MRTNKFVFTAIAVAALGAAGCSHGPLRADFGNSTMVNIDSQVVNAQAGEQAAATNAVDGQKVEKGLERYRADKPDASRGKLLSEMGN